MKTEPQTMPQGDDPKIWIDWTTHKQGLASNPDSSAWVSANAGSGKTHVLTQRVIRLLLSGCRPSAILCLTYTKAAASEMSNRVFARLAEWAVLDDRTLSERIAAIEGEAPDRAKLAEARRLFARALETPGGLKIQTIHAFCESLLHQFPLEANVAGHFSVLDDSAANALLATARRSLLTATTMEGDTALAAAFALVLSLADNSGLDVLLSEIVAGRQAISAFLAHAERHGGVDAALREGYGLGPHETPEDAAGLLWPLPGLCGASLTAYLELAAAKGGSQVRDIAASLEAATVETDPLRRLEHLQAAFFKKDGDPKAAKTLVSKPLRDAAPQLDEAVQAAVAHIVLVRDRLRLFNLLETTAAALTLAARLLADYDELKKRRSQLDFADLISQAADLLTRADVSAWVHYKLDRGIDHILVDEAQDTSPVQWSVIQSLAGDFFSGASGRDEAVRTIFAVGDEKQSIYSFQGARPERFSAEREATETKVTAGGRRFSRIVLPVSFRSTGDILSAVDQVFSFEANARGLSASQEPVVHVSSRIGQPGIVDLWEMIAPEKQADDEDWTAPFDSIPEGEPPAILARRMAHSIQQMIGREILNEKGHARLVEPGDILVLVRKRDSFVNALTRALKNLDNIPVAGADRLTLTGHIAVQDLMALGRFLLCPGDDLSLAAVLKSPLFNLSEEDILDLAARRGEQQGLWARLKEVSAESERIAGIVPRLSRLMGLAHRLSVHDFYARLLGADGGRRKFLARLGSEVGDILDEFLTFALDHETSGLPGLQSFLATLETDAPVVKREQDKGRNEVRIMTVHASKGLEAPVVFLVDGGSRAFSQSHLPRLRTMARTDGLPPLPAWLAGKATKNALTDADTERGRQQAEEEYRRLLYVGMTRAADRLVICGYRGVTQNAGIWHAMIREALAASELHCAEHRFTLPDGTAWEGLRWRSTASGDATPEKSPVQTQREAVNLPAALAKPLPPQTALPRPLSPSGAGAIIDDGLEETAVTSPLFGGKGPDNAVLLQRGMLIHRMLQVLPRFAVDEREAAARRYAERAATGWSDEAKAELVSSALAVLAHPDLTALFSPAAKAEVSVMGTLTIGGRSHPVSGRIDRIADDGTRVTITDFKTNLTPPARPSDIPFAHRAQLALYREILKPLYPGRDFECLLVYTQSANVFRLPGEMLEDALVALAAK